MGKKALITGITGQDGAYLSSFLLTKGYEVYGVFRRLSTPNFWRLQDLGIVNQIHTIAADIIDSSSILDAVRLSEPDEVYHLAAQSFVGYSFQQPIGTGEVTGLGVTRILEALRQAGSNAKFYHASSSEQFGDSPVNPKTETTPFFPASPYAVAKLYGHWISAIYRDAYNIFCSNGILFNHESPLRGLEFVTRKISNSAARIKLGLQKELTLGNLDAYRDWGYAPEYVEAMWLMLQQDTPGDYIIATNESHSVKEFVELAFSTVDLDWQEYVKVADRLMRPKDVMYLQGDYSKAKEELGWTPRTTFRELVRIMVEADLQRWQQWLNGEKIRWDALNYPDNVS